MFFGTANGASKSSSTRDLLTAAARVLENGVGLHHLLAHGNAGIDGDCVHFSEFFPAAALFWNGLDTCLREPYVSAVKDR